MVEYKAILNSSQVMIGCAVVAAIATNLYIWLRFKKKSKLPEKWIPVGNISNLMMYPLKSGAGVAIMSAECTNRGMKEKSSDVHSPTMLDRSLMVYDEKTGNFLNCKSERKLLQISVKRNDKNSMVLSAPGSEDIEVRFPSENGKLCKCVMYDSEEVNVVDCGDEVAQWLGKYFGKEGSWRLGYYVSDEIGKRTPTDATWRKYTDVYNKLRKEDLGAFSDIASYMVLTEESLKELNGRLEPDNQVTHKNFRPNIMVSTTQKSPFAEDNWDWIKIGDKVIMRQVKPCTRCVVITMDPSNGVYNKQREPLKTLESFRQVTDPEQKKIEGKSPAFGQYFGIHNLGSISIGDTVYVGSN